MKYKYEWRDRNESIFVSPHQNLNAMIYENIQMVFNLRIMVW